MLDSLVLVGPASVHTSRVLSAVAPLFRSVHLVTSGAPRGPLPGNMGELCTVDFSSSSFLTPLRIDRFLRRTSPSVIHVQQANTCALHTHLANRRKTPVVLTAWGSDVLLLPDSSWLSRRMVEFNLRRSHAVTVDSRYGAARIGIVSRRGSAVHVLNFGLEPEWVEPVPFDAKDNIILSPRLHAPLYRIGTIVDAFASLAADPALREWKLMVAGAGEGTETLKRQAAGAGIGERVEFPGFLARDELLTLCRRSRVVVSVPESDSSSLSLLEGMAAGGVPVVSAIPANHEWVFDGHNGFVCGKMESLTQYLRRGVEAASSPSRYEEIAGVNRRLIAANASVAAFTAGMAAIYESAVAGTRGRGRCL